MEQRLSMVTLGVADLDRSRRFYTDLGWRRGNDDAEVVFFQAAAWCSAYGRAGPWPRMRGVPAAGSGFSGITLAYNTRTREEVDAVLAEAKAAGATIPKPAEDAFWGGYSGYFADPDGHLWEVAWNPYWTIADDGGVSLGA